METLRVNLATSTKRRNSMSILTKALSRKSSLSPELVKDDRRESMLRRESEDYLPQMPAEESNVADAIDISQDSLDDFLKLNKLNPSEL